MSGSWTFKLDSPMVTPQGPNYRLPIWPPPQDFPITVDAAGATVSRFGDAIWNFSPYATESTVINFGDGPVSGMGAAIDSANAHVFRQVMAWLIFGDRPMLSAGTVRTQFSVLRPLFVLCAEAGISASELSRFPRVAEQLPGRIAVSAADRVFALLHDLWQARDQLGFVLLDREGLRRLEGTLPDHEGKQTPYIPPRIWLYQVQRLRAFIDDFHAHRAALEALYRYCVKEYATPSGSLAGSCAPSIGRRQKRTSTSGRKECSRFSEVAARFGVGDLLKRWCSSQGEFSPRPLSIRTLTQYLSQVDFVGTAYLINFSGMRIAEEHALKADCLQIEQDERFGSVYLLRGRTTKTLHDEDALWVTSPTVDLAVQAIRSVATLRTEVATARGHSEMTLTEKANRYLHTRVSEPWMGSFARSAAFGTLEFGPKARRYIHWQTLCPSLFDVEQLRIRKGDLDLARLITPTLNPRRFDVGLEWAFTWHQLRRTMAVNMAASGLVSDASLQYQLKHLSRAMALYYGRGYSRLHLNPTMRDEYIRTTYEMTLPPRNVSLAV